MRQESHRIHWQQWGKDPQSKRDLVTRSAAVRLTDAATARNVIQLLGETLQLEGQGALILVATLYNMPHVKFEHEQSSNDAAGEPFHLVRTLQYEENPLQVRDLMKQVLETKQQQYPHLKSASSMIAPKLSWYFVPEDPASQMRNCIELDGYSTAMEEEDFDDHDDEEDETYEHVEPVYPDPMDMPWRTKEQESKNADYCATSKESLEQEERSMKQMQRYQQLALHRTVLDHYVVSGYLWKQSHIDPHVWRKVHCVLSEDHLWFVARVKKRKKCKKAAAHYGRITLTHALLVESSSSSHTISVMSRIPFSWEVVSASGGSHFFRASSKALQRRWTRCLKDRILQCQENKLLRQAELIVADETTARNKRLTKILEPSSNSNSDLMQWALQVVDYREQCRHIQHRLPTKTLIVSRSSSALTKQESSSSIEMPELDPDLQVMVRAAWDLGATLLVQATTKLLTTKGHNAVETLCRHIDYVLTGRMRSLSEVGTPLQEELVDKSRDPPPSDLFDSLLAEFQKIATIVN